MLRLTLAQMRRSIGRLSAAGVAIVIGTAFVAATLLGGNLITRSAFDAISAQYARADLVVSTSATFTPQTVDTIRSTAGVAQASGMVQSWQGLVGGDRTIFQQVIPTTPDPRLMPLVLSKGAWPTGADQIALPPDVATRLSVGVGDTIGLQTHGSDSETQTRRLTVTGLVDDPRNAYGGGGGAAVMDVTALDALQKADGGELTYREITVLLADGASLPSVTAALRDAVPHASVVTPDEHAQAVAQRLSGGQDLFFLIFVLTFAAIALLVAGLVITNTFQVLVAQRTRTLALLRAVGANKRQVGAGVLLEAGILGVVSSLIGVVLGCGLGQLALTIAGHTSAAAFLPHSISVTWAVVVIPLLVGVAVTVLASLVPARVATRVAPLAALRPADGPTLEKGSAGRVRLVLSVLVMVLGFGLLALGAALGTVGGDAQMGLLAGIAGGALSFVGVAVSAVFWMPRVTSWSGRLVGLSGPTARLASANTLRNPRRTAATSTALLIGVTLVAMMSTGAASARTSLTAQLDQQFPIDVAVDALGDANGAADLPANVVTAVNQASGVRAVARPKSASLVVGGIYAAADGSIGLTGDGTVPTPQNQVSTPVVGIDPAQAKAVLNDPSLVKDVEAGSVVVPSFQAYQWHLTDGSRLTLTGPTGPVTLTVVVDDGGHGIGSVLLVDQADLLRADAHPAQSSMWVALAPGDLSAVSAIQDAVGDTGAPVTVQGAAVERASYETVIDTALGIVVGLLGVAVVIALIGVANTLSLSVLERRRESATLRAIGVTRGQLRWMLAVEGMLIAGVGAVLGIVLGLVYGWAGSLAGLGVMGPVVLSVPWRDIVLAAVIALVAGLVASVAPGRSAVRPSPVAALATE
ncbi:MAG: FtsX-like permease family protein [Promicromonosporaceae bacterium]|nr:FtsX-like permease family protein [Promicromonosporaceae bacterium]